MADYLTPDARRRIAGGLMAAQYDRATPEEGNVAQRHGLLPLATYDNGRTGLAFPGFVADPLESWGRLLKNGYTPGDTQGVEDAFNVVGAAMMGGLAAPKPRNVARNVEQPISVTGYRGVTDTANIKSPDRVTFYSDRPELADLYARDYQSYGRRWPWEDDKTMYANAARSDAAPWPSADRPVAVKGSDVGYSDGSAVVRRDMTFNRPWTITGEELTSRIDASGGFGIGDVLPELVQQARSRGVDGIVLKDVQDIGGKQNQFISLFANGGKQGAGIGSAIGSAGGDLKGAALGAIPDQAALMDRTYSRFGKPPPRDPFSNPENGRPFTGSGWHGSPDNELAAGAVFDRADPSMHMSPHGPWIASNRDVASTYTRVEPEAPFFSGSNVMPMEARFKNPMVYDAQGRAGGEAYIAPGNVAWDTNDISGVAKQRGYDGLVVRNVRDELQGGGALSDVFHPLQRGTVYSPITGDLLFANGGRPGAGMGAAMGGDTPQDVNPMLAEILRKYGLDLPSRPASPQYRPGDA